MSTPAAGVPGRTDSAIHLGWARALGFAVVVAVVGYAVSAAIVLPAVTWPTDRWGLAPGLLLTGLGIAAVAVPLLTLVLVALPPQSRWGVVRRAIAVSYPAVAVATLIGSAAAPVVVLISLALFTATGAFLVPAMVAALCAPMLDPRLRTWRRRAESSAAGRAVSPAPPPEARSGEDRPGSAGSPP